MKLYRQGNNEIRIRLTREDLASYETTVEDLDYDSPQGKRMILALLDKAKREMGFETSGEKIYIQLYPTGPGGCELFVTKLEREKKYCFRFSDFDTLFKALPHTAFPAESQLWQEKKSGRFYVFVSQEETPPLFFEFGEKIKPPSHIFLKSRCRKANREERESNGSE